ncbi:MAG: alpha/beta hydrolase [Candidatus Thermoplasmatota archaeon]|nr:alpha/beta hydrolase [Candidatus Thermoplasmatota archaeon]
MTEKGNGSEKRMEHSTLAVKGGHIAYDTAGRGTPVLFIHAAIADRRMWNREMSVFAEEHQTVRFDMRGYGQSSPASAPFSCVDDIRALTKHLLLEKPFLVGCSMGGGFAVSYAIEFPEEVSGLLLAAPGVSGVPFEAFSKEDLPAFEYDERKSKEIARLWSEGKSSEAYEKLRELWCSKLTGKNLELFREMVEQNMAEIFTENSMQHIERGRPSYNLLETIRVPTTVLVGDMDNPSSVPFSRLVSKEIPGSSLVLIRGADHLINLSRTDDFERELRNALNSIR